MHPNTSQSWLTEAPFQDWKKLLKVESKLSRTGMIGLKEKEGSGELGETKDLGKWKIVLEKKGVCVCVCLCVCVYIHMLQILHKELYINKLRKESILSYKLRKTNLWGSEQQWRLAFMSCRKL